MGAETKIEWADHTFNPWIGCQRVSEACDNCYAEALMDKRFGRVEWGPGKARQLTSDQNWRDTFKWDRKAELAGRRARVFCSSLADVFDNAVPERWRRHLWAIIESTPNLDWLLLTKRPQNIEKMLPPGWGRGWANVWLGATVEHQKAANLNIQHLLYVPAVRRFLSCEPLLGTLDLEHVRGPINWCQHMDGLNCLTHGIDWVIAGGEAVQPNQTPRPAHPDWFRSLRDQCERAGAAFLFKQWGDWAPYTVKPGGEMRAGRVVQLYGAGREPDGHFRRGDVHMERVGKREAGRLLDGRTHDDIPASVERTAAS